MLCSKATSLWLLLGATALTAWGGEPPTEEKPKEGRFLRLVRDEAGSPLSLEAALVRLVPSDRRRNSPTVDLVSAVHVAEKSYYDQLNRLFARYDAVLYELKALLIVLVLASKLHDVGVVRDLSFLNSRRWLVSDLGLIERSHLYILTMNDCATIIMSTLSSCPYIALLSEYGFLCYLHPCFFKKKL